MKTDDKNSQTCLIHLLNGVEENTPIMQYMDLDYLFQLLEKQSYHVSRKYTFEDALEGDFPKKSIFPLSAVGPNNKPHPKQEVESCLRIWKQIQENRDVPTSCWTYNMTDRMVMWKNYTPKFGACIKSSVHKVIASIVNNVYDIWCGKISYHGYYAQKGLMDNLFSKISAYSEEEECRFYFFECEHPQTILPYIKIDICSSVMIDEVILSPFINKKTSEKLAMFMQSEYGIKVSPSNIKLKS